MPSNVIRYSELQIPSEQSCAELGACLLRVRVIHRDGGRRVTKGDCFVEADYTFSDFLPLVYEGKKQRCVGWLIRAEAGIKRVCDQVGMIMMSNRFVTGGELL